MESFLVTFMKVVDRMVAPALAALAVFVFGFITALNLAGALGCRPSPAPLNPPPTPAFGGTSGVAGSPATFGGQQAFGGQSAGAAGATAAVVEFPSCNPETRQAAPLVRHKLGRARKPVKARPRASYRIVSGVESQFWAPLIASSLDQLDLGSCTGNATVGARLAKPHALATLPAPWDTVTSAREFQRLAVDVYSKATLIDPFAGAYPPDDTGSDGKSATTVAVRMGLFGGFRVTDTFDELQMALQSGPCIFGSDWHTKMFSPDRCGQVQPEGPVEGGHEYAVVGIEVARKLLWFSNSWGNDWGVKWGRHGGYFNLTFGDFLALYNAGGEVECPQ